MKLILLMDSKKNIIEKEYNYSKVGKFSIQKYSYLIDKNHIINDKLLKYKNRKKLFNDFFQEPIPILTPKTEDIESFFSEDDIFKENKPNISNKNKKDIQVKSSCSNLNKGKNSESNSFYIKANLINNNFNRTFDKFKYHLIHHNESPNNLMDKKRISPSCTRYNPKLEYIYKKLIYSISFKKMSGRQNKIKKEDIKEFNYSKIKTDKEKQRLSGIKKSKSTYSENSMNNSGKNIRGSVNMKFQLSRKSLPNHNDFRIRKDSHNNSNLSLSHKDKADIFQKMYKTHLAFKTPRSSNNNLNLTNYKKYSKISTPPFQSSLNILKNSHSKDIMNTKIKKEEKNNNEKTPLNMEKNESNILKNEKIKFEIEKNKLARDSESKSNDNNTIIDKNSNDVDMNLKKDKENQEKEKSKIFKDPDYLDFINKRKFINNESLNKKNNNKNKNSNKNKKAELFESNSCLNINNFKSKNMHKKNYKGINFEKMLSREYLDKINRYEEPIHPMITPNYSAIDPKSIMKVIYSKKEHNRSPEKFHGFNGDFTFDIDKIFYKYNNHLSPRTFNLNKMRGRHKDSNDILPFFMQKLFDRNSIDNFNENSLKMNNYSNGSFQEIKSSFNDKKSFNIRLQLEQLKKKENVNIIEYKNKNNNNNNVIKKLNNIHKNNLEKYSSKNRKLMNLIANKKSLRKLLGEFYLIDFDEIDKSNAFMGRKIDGITLKSYDNKNKYPNLLSKKDKNIFLFDVNNN